MGRATRREIEQRVMTALPSWVNTISQLNRMIAERMGVTASDLGCLHVLHIQGPATAAELAREVGLTPGSVSRMIDRLDAAGCITRTDDPEDRRRVLIEASAEGLARIATYYDGLTARSHEDLAEFTLAEMAVLLRFIERSQIGATEELARLRRTQ